MLRSRNVMSHVEQESFLVFNNGCQFLPRSAFVRADVGRVLIDAQQPTIFALRKGSFDGHVQRLSPITDPDPQVRDLSDR